MKTSARAKEMFLRCKSQCGNKYKFMYFKVHINLKEFQNKGVIRNGFLEEVCFEIVFGRSHCMVGSLKESVWMMRAFLVKGLM